MTRTMSIRPRLRAPATRRRRPRPVATPGLFGVLTALAVLATTALIAADPGPGQAALERLMLTASAIVGLAVALDSTGRAQGRARAVRAFVALGFVGWTASQLFQDVVPDVVAPGGAGVPPVFLVVIVVAAAGAYRAVLVGRMSGRERFGIYLDGAILFAFVAGLLLARHGHRVDDPIALSVLMHAIFFLGLAGATVILDLAVLAPVEPRGAYALLGGLVVVGVGFVGRAATTAVEGGTFLAAGIISIGVLLVAYGTATWSDRMDHGPRYERFAQRIRNVLPLVAVGLVPALLNAGDAPTTPPLIRTAENVTIAFIVLAAVVRQTILLRERDVVLGGLRRALDAAEQRTQQLSGVEAIGHVLASDRPGPAVLDEVVALLARRFGYRYIAIYLSDGTALRARAQRGYADPLPVLDASDGVMGRVVRTRRPALVLDVASDPDYIAVEPSVRTEISVPILEGDRLHGVLHVASSVPGSLTEADLAAVLAVADQIAGSIALQGERQRLVDEKDFVNAILDTVGAVVVVVDAVGHTVRVNGAAAELSGFSVDELEASPSLDFLVPADQRHAVRTAIGTLSTTNRKLQTENDWIHRDGSRRRIVWSNTAVFDEDGSVRYAIATGTDITERKQLEEQLAHQALHDPLTGLPNRTLLMDRVGQALRSRHGGIVGLLFIDLDDFKAVNDTLGHAVGDRLLTDLATRLLGCLRTGDTAARIGGDEFAVVLEDLESVEEAEAVAARIRTAFATPVQIDGQEANVDASIGIATNLAEPLEAELLLRRADLAMYWAKREGRARSAVYEPHMHEQVRERRELEALLRGALDRGEFELHYQPMFDLRTQELVATEALLRWRQPARGLMAPGEFLTALEETGEIVAVGRWVIGEATRQLARWRHELGPRAPGSVTVNVSARQLQDPRLVSDVAAALAAAPLDPSSLVLELTEGLLMEDTDATVRHLDAMKELGIRLAVDDFGTGYSSLSYLHRFPVDILKIDRSFVARMGADPRQASFVRAIISLGRSLGLETVAEGIETPVQLAALSALRCHVGQGFFFSGPLAPGAFAAQHIEPRTVLARRTRQIAG